MSAPMVHTAMRVTTSARVCSSLFSLETPSCTEFPIAHEALSRWVMALIVGVKGLEKVVTAVKELA
jgi:hypothetical protein